MLVTFVCAVTGTTENPDSKPDMNELCVCTCLSPFGSASGLVREIESSQGRAVVAKLAFWCLAL